MEVFGDDYPLHQQALGYGSTSGASGDPTPSPSPVIRRRAPIACRRCRRMRSKCVHDRARPPCKACDEAGLEAVDCEFPVRGQPANDREYRHPRIRSSKSTMKRDTARARRSTLESRLNESDSCPEDEWESLPPLSEIIEAVDCFTRQYFLLGFLPKQQFPDRLRKDLRSVNLFLILSILSISARLSPSLIARYGTGIKAADFFMERAAAVAVGEIYKEPTLESCQAFYLLSIAQQGSGSRNKSHINLGIAMRMATLMRLHREETYRIDIPIPELVIRAESARRTLWMLHSQDSLHSGPFSPVSLAASDITALLPCDEPEFAAGRLPRSRAALPNTPPSLENPSLVYDPSRSVFASLIQIHHFWGIIGRRAATYGRMSTPWDPNSQWAQTIEALQKWEVSLPRDHTWSKDNLEKHRTAGQHLGYLGVTMMTRLCHIVARRSYLSDIVNLKQKVEPERSFFASLSVELFSNVHGLFEQIEAQFTTRSPGESVGAQMAAFCVYSCGLFSTYLCKYPGICPDSAIAGAGPFMLSRTQAILLECKEVWPLASRWLESLDKAVRDPYSTTLAHESSMDDGKDLIPNILNWVPPSARHSHSADLSPSFTSSTCSDQSGFHHDRSVQEQSQKHQQQASQSLLHSLDSFHLQSEPRLLDPYGQAVMQTAKPQAPFSFTRDTVPLPAVNGLGLHVSPFQPPEPTPVQQTPHTYGTNTSRIGHGPAPQYLHPCGPRGDGYESELLYYIGGSVDWAQSMGWDGGLSC